MSTAIRTILDIDTRGGSRLLEKLVGTFCGPLESPIDIFSISNRDEDEILPEPFYFYHFCFLKGDPGRDPPLDTLIFANEILKIKIPDWLQGRIFRTNGQIGVF